MVMSVKHYRANGKEYTGAYHKMPNGKLHSGAKHTASSKVLFHYGDLSKNSQAKARSNWKT
mgnify:CR=1|tara:strand:+ start:367 stop:549 length:183 start_codon:yes stop_codon:yes gene_type:complete